MLGFDYELRRLGLAGNSCQIILELSTKVDPVRLEARLAALNREHPILRSRPARGGLNPRWKPTNAVSCVRVHERDDDLLQRLFNEPLDIQRGELIRFDVFESTLIFTWSHALMDAKSAEYFLALVGSEQVGYPEPKEDWYAQRALRAGTLRARGRQAWRELERLDEFRAALPVSLATRRPPGARAMRFHVVALTDQESACIRAHAARMCGLLGNTTFHLAATLVELHRLHERAGCPSESYVVPIPVSLRPKGTRAPLFSNQVTMILHQFLPRDLATIEGAVAAVKSRNTDSLRGNYLDAGVTLAQLFRGLPLSLYMRIIKHGLRGEICSLFFGDTGDVDFALETFLDTDIEGLVHVPAVTVPPGVGVVFYRFRNELRFTVVHASGILSDIEAADFAGHLRDRLLNP
jgi:diacylglycerol O-acyltransferase / wax synthase